MAGIESGEVFSNLAELEAIGPDGVKFHAFKTCLNSDDEMIGTQYIV